MAAATKEFQVASAKYTPRKAVYNGVDGRLWTKRELVDGAWVLNGERHVRKEASETEVECAFESGETDHVGAERYWDQA